MITTLAAFLSGHNYLFVFREKLLSIEAKLSKTAPSLHICLYVFIFIVGSEKAIWIYFLVSDFLIYHKHAQFAFFWMYIRWGCLFNAFIRCAVFEWHWHTMKKLRIVFEERLYKTTSMARIERKDIEDTLLIYADLLDALNSIGFIMKSLVLSRMLVDDFYYMAIFIFPCIIMELVKSEVDKIRIMLTDIYTESSDEGVVRKAEDSLKFLDLCPYEFVVWHLIPVNIKLPLNVLAVLTSYMIITLQLAYLSG
ncbi:unnamed protein product [Leptosia nina]|uniref:Gustatory receptor n=1 Tax=Leptosia nina TaxID=320188 RepID=A0AAV1J9Z2_9NEOP